MHLILLFLALFGQNPKHSHNNHQQCPSGQVSTLDDDPGDMGHVPPKPPTNPPGGEGPGGG